MESAALDDEFNSDKRNIHPTNLLPQLKAKTKNRNNKTNSNYKKHYRSNSSYSSIRENALLSKTYDEDNDNEQQHEYIKNLKVYGYMIIVITWLVFTISIGTIFNLWQWCFKFDSSYLESLKSISWINIIINDINQQNNNAVDNYYILYFFLIFVILWIWAVDSWISMKLFRHSKGGGS